MFETKVKGVFGYSCQQVPSYSTKMVFPHLINAYFSYQKAWRDYVKFRHLLANMSKPTYEDKRKLETKENKLNEMRTQGKMKRDVTVAVSAEGFFRTGIMCDVIQVSIKIVSSNDFNEIMTCILACNVDTGSSMPFTVSSFVKYS